MTFTRQFEVNSELPKAELPPGTPTPVVPTVDNIKSDITSALIQMTSEVVISDLCNMISKDQTFSLEGYVMCLYRIIAHDKGWDCITQAFSQLGKPIPEKIKKLYKRT